MLKICVRKTLKEKAAGLPAAVTFYCVRNTGAFGLRTYRTAHRNAQIILRSGFHFRSINVFFAHGRQKLPQAASREQGRE